MKGGAENRKKTITLGVLGAVAFSGVLYNLYAVFGGPSTPPPTVAPVSSVPAPPLANRAAAINSTGALSANGSNGAGAGAGMGIGAAPGVPAQALASASSSLDPTLNQAAMLRTESLVYTGSGRNIFSATSTVVAPITLPRNVPPPRPNPVAYTPPPQPQGPPPPPPIPLKFFGTAQRGQGAKQAFLLSDDNVYLAAPGDIVARRFKVGAISPYGIQVTDLTNNNTQTLPLQQN